MSGEHPRPEETSEGFSDDGSLSGSAVVPPAEMPNDDRLAGLRAAIDDVDELPIDDRLALFERVNAELASQLAALDEL